MSRQKTADRPCASCPWLRANQTPDAVARSPVDGNGVHWFSVANLRRHWSAAGTIGAMLPCHKTDAHAPLYGGAPTKGGHESICVGLSVLARREVTAFMQAGGNTKRYRAIGPGRRFLMPALAAWASRLYFGGCVFHVGDRQFTMPEKVEDDPRVGLPWSDAIHNQEVTK